MLSPRYFFPRTKLAKCGKFCYIENMKRREYKLSIVVNGIHIKKVIVDPHYEERHLSSIDDDLILELVKTLDGEFHEQVDEKSPFKYFVKNEIEHDGKSYRLIWLLEDNQIYVGVVNAFRSKK